MVFTKEMAEGLAAWDRDKLKNQHFANGLGDPPRATGGRLLGYMDQCNYPARINTLNYSLAVFYAIRGGKFLPLNTEAPRRRTTAFAIKYVHRGQGSVSRTSALMRCRITRAMTKHGVVLKVSNCPSIPWIDNFRVTKRCCGCWYEELDEQLQISAYLIDAVTPNAKGEPGPGR
jgi:hypothetical protein